MAGTPGRLTPCSGNKGLLSIIVALLQTLTLLLELQAKELLRAGIPEGEATKCSNGRWSCLVFIYFSPVIS